MTTYVVGDVQGCDAPLARLLERIGFDPTRDRLWLTGDLVNRGPASLAVLRRVMALGDAAVSVLGNHDLTLLAVAAGHVRRRRKDSFGDVLDAPDSDALLDWLRHRPLLHTDPQLGCLVHAGLPPAWDIDTARREASAVEATLRGPDCNAFLAAMFGNAPRRWRADLAGTPRLRYAVNALTRMRYLEADGALNFDCKTAPAAAPPALTPWFAAPGRASATTRIFCGHWAALGLYRGANVYAVDTGCVWGQALTALAADDPDGTAWSVPAHAT